jgi:uncharacterized membrane protein
MLIDEPARREWVRVWIGRLIVVGALVASTLSFLPHQTIWLDESVQLAGMTLPPVSVTRWLANTERHDFGLFRDRMPPLSYWAHWGWSRVFGAGETAMRLMGVVAVAIAVLLIFEAAKTLFGDAAGLAAGLLFGLSPPVVVLAVEIRAYPLFMLWSALAFLALAKVLEPSVSATGKRVWTVLLGLALVAAIGTHFYGIVMAGAIVSAWLLATIRRGERIAPTLLVGSIAAIAAACDIPFVLAALEMGEDEPTPPDSMGRRLIAVQRLTDKLLNHTSLSVYGIAGLAVSLGVVLLLALATRRLNRPGPARGVIALALGLGIVAVAAAKLLSTGFDAAAPHYNTWMRPALCILLTAGLAAASRRHRVMTAFCLSAIIVADCAGVYQLATRGRLFAHGPHRQIATALRQLESTDVGVVHDDPSTYFFFVYSPLRLDFGPSLAQYRRARAAAGDLSVRPDRRHENLGNADRLPHRYLAVVRSEPASGPQLVSMALKGVSPLAPGPIATSVAASKDWRLVRSQTIGALTSARLDIFERIGVPDEKSRQATRTATEGTLR